MIALITDRFRRADDGGRLDALVGRVAAAARAGVHLIQIRERDLDAGAQVRLVAACVEAVRETRARIVVNDRTDVARAAGAHGVHLRGDSAPAPRVRAVAGPGFLIGRSVHSVSEAVQAAGEGAVDYLIFGPVFPTASKPGLAPAGTEMLEAVVRATTIPVLAVGGVTSEAAPVLARVGAAGAAAIGLFADADGDAAMHDAVAALRRAFDSAGGHSYHSGRHHGLRPLPRSID